MHDCADHEFEGPFLPTAGFVQRVYAKCIA